MNPTDTPQVGTISDSEENKKITIELSPGGTIGCQISNLTPLKAASLMIQAADIIISGVEDRPFIEICEDLPDLRKEMREVEAMWNAKGREQ